MRDIFFRICFICVLVKLLTCGQDVSAQFIDSIYITKHEIDTLHKGQLSVEIDNLSFFKNNEFNSTIQKGYTLPGFWLQPKAVYYPLSNVKLEAGVHSIWFWGAWRYPAFAFKDISRWSGRDYSHNVHISPYFRAHFSMSKNVSIVLGNIYGGSNHRLIEPLYNPELNLSSDPEAGLQFLYKSKWVNFDSWVDWMTYIYELDTHQESFVAGASARFLTNSPESRFHVYFPLQGVAQHRGGEIDNNTTEPVQTIMNGALGVGLKLNLKNRLVKYINAEFDLAGYHFPKGREMQLHRGRGFYSKLEMQLESFNIKTSYWNGKNFVSMFGNHFYNSVSSKMDGNRYDNPQMLYLGANYVHSLGKGFSLGVMAETYYFVSGKMYSSQTGLYEPSAYGKNSNFSVGICMRINPSFLIKQY